MMVREYILAKLSADPITKIMREPGQGNIDILEQELAEKVAKIKTTEDVVGKGKKFIFLVVLWQQKYGAVIGNPAVRLYALDSPGEYDETIQAKDLAFD